MPSDALTKGLPSGKEWRVRLDPNDSAVAGGG